MVERGLFSGKSMNQVSSWNIGLKAFLTDFSCTIQHGICSKSVKRNTWLRGVHFPGKLLNLIICYINGFKTFNLTERIRLLIHICTGHKSVKNIDVRAVVPNHCSAEH
jgi:hypothetical protein